PRDRTRVARRSVQRRPDHDRRSSPGPRSARAAASPRARPLLVGVRGARGRRGRAGRERARAAMVGPPHRAPVRDYISLIVSGLPVGGMYALAAIGIVLIYRTTGTLNFAQGAVATSAAFVFHSLTADDHLPLVLALGGALAVSLLLGLLIERVLRLIGSEQVMS